MRDMRLAPCLLVPLLAGALAPGARAETANVTPSGFLVTHRQEVSAPPHAVYEALGRVGEWWSGEHTYSGNAGNSRCRSRPVTYPVRAADGSVDKVAAVVDRVIGEQARRLAAYAAPK